MKKEVRTAVYDDELEIEAYRFEGIVQPFPNHFHEYYVIGLAEIGERRLICNGNTYALSAGDMLILNPGESHGCVQSDNGVFNYRALNITKEKMSELSEEITGKSYLPRFTKNVLRTSGGLADCFYRLHEAIMRECGEFEKEEALLILISELIKQTEQPFLECISRQTASIERACKFMEEHCGEHITLNQLCSQSGLSKSTLLRSFMKSRGITPYRYLQAVRINKAKELLEQGIKPVDAAFQTGFSDQSHFTNYFVTFIGLPPTTYSRFFRENKEVENEK